METTNQAEATQEATPPPAPAQGPQFPEGTMLREYETIYLVKPDLIDEQVDRLKERLRELVARDGGKVIKFTVWGKKKVQYEIAKGSRAIYVHMQYLGPSPLVAEVERNLRMIDDVIRYQTVKISDATDANRPVEHDVKLAGDVEQPDRPPREDRDRRDDRGLDDGSAEDESED